MSDRNSAYRLPEYEKQDDGRIKKTESNGKDIIRYKPNSDISAKAAAKYVLFVGIFAVLLFMVVSVNGEITEIQRNINAMNKEVIDLRSENTRLRTEIESKSGMKAVEDYAVNVLGMRKLEKSQCEYISLQSGNVIEIPEDESNIFVKIKNKFNEMVEYLKG